MNECFLVIMRSQREAALCHSTGLPGLGHPNLACYNAMKAEKPAILIAVGAVLSGRRAAALSARCKRTTLVVGALEDRCAVN